MIDPLDIAAPGGGPHRPIKHDRSDPWRACFSEPMRGYAVSRTVDPNTCAQEASDDSRLQRPEPRAAPGSTERTPRSPDAMPRQHPEEHFGRGQVEISLISAVRTHALCVHTQDCFGGRHQRAGRRGTAAHRPHLAARTLHTHAYAALIRPREKHPRNSHLRRAPERETACQALAPLHEVRA